MLSASEISEAKKRTQYCHGKTEVLHQHDDCIRIAYEWLDAQVQTKGVIRRARPLKHIIENWAGRYVSQSDVEVAANLHPRIKGHTRISTSVPGLLCRRTLGSPTFRKQKLNTIRFPRVTSSKPMREKSNA